MSLRILEIYHQEEPKNIKEILDEAKVITFDIKSGKLDGENITKILLDCESVDGAIEALEKKITDSEFFRINIYSIEATLPRPEEEEEKSEEIEEKGEDEENSGRVSIEEIYRSLSDEVEISYTYIVLVIIASIVAAVGIIYNDIPVIVGSMVIAPLITPSMGISLATTLADVDLIKRSWAIALTGFVFPIFIGIIFGLMLSIDPTSPQIATRTDISLLHILLALSAGIAGSLSITKGVSQALVGVMIAIALLPPLVVTGLLIGNGLYSFALGSSILFLVNFISINLSSIATFVFQDVWPKRWWEKERAEKMVKRAVASWIFMLLLMVVLIQIYQYWA